MGITLQTPIAFTQTRVERVTIILERSTPEVAAEVAILDDNGKSLRTEEVKHPNPGAFLAQVLKGTARQLFDAVDTALAAGKYPGSTTANSDITY